MNRGLNPSSFRKIIVTVMTGLVTIGLFVLFFVVSYIIFPPAADTTPSSEPSQESDDAVITAHAHAALMIFVNGRPMDFTDSKYQNQDIRIHFEDNDGFTLHKHDRSVWLGPFLESLNMTFADNCLTLPDASSYCSNFETQITFWVNGVQNTQFQHYVPRDDDRILISYGRLEDIGSQLDSLNSIVLKS